MKKKIIIIGAGPAGLTAAFELVKHNYEVIVLEADTRVGGISKTVTIEGNRMDLGGHRFFSKEPKVLEWWKSFLPLQSALPKDDRILHRTSPVNPKGADPEKVNEVMLVRNRTSRIYYNKKFFDYPVSMKWKTIKNMGIATTIEAGISYLCATLHKRTEDNLENFYINRFGKKLYSMFFESYTEKLWGRHPKEISADWGAQRVKGLSILAVVKDMFGKILCHKDNHKDNRKVETSLIEQFWYPKLGPGQLWELVAEEFVKQGGTLITGATVQGIFKDQNQISSISYQQEETEVHLDCDYLISTMPIKDLVQSFRKEKVPDSVARIAEGLPYRDYITVGMLFSKLALKNQTEIPTLGNIIPDNWMYIQDAGVKMGRIQIFNNWSPYMVNNPEHSVWIGLEFFCDENDDFWNLSEEDCADLALKELRQMGIVDADTFPMKTHRERVKKAYPAYFDTYSEIDTLISWLDGIENLFCIGRNGQHRYNNMDHSMMTAFEAVENILSGRKDKSNIWNVNTEQEYHEKSK